MPVKPYVFDFLVLMVDVMCLDGVAIAVVANDRVGDELMFRKRLQPIEIFRLLQVNNINFDDFKGSSIL